MTLDKGHLLPAQERLTRVAVNVVEVRAMYSDAIRLALYAGIQPELARGVVVKYGEPRGPHQELVNDRPRYRLRLIYEDSVALWTVRSVGFFNREKFEDSAVREGIGVLRLAPSRVVVHYAGYLLEVADGSLLELRISLRHHAVDGRARVLADKQEQELQDAEGLARAGAPAAGQEVRGGLRRLYRLCEHPAESHTLYFFSLSIASSSEGRSITTGAVSRSSDGV